jgi:hypothetical protein
MMRRRVVRRGGVGLLGAAAIGGTAYAVGSSNARSANREQQQEARLAQLEASQAPPPQYAAPPSPPAPTKDRVQQLKELADLRQTGMLTDEEFEREKRLILRS